MELDGPPAGPRREFLMSLRGSEALLSPCYGKKKKASEGDSERDLTVPALNHPQESLSLATNFKGNLP